MRELIVPVFVYPSEVSVLSLADASSLGAGAPALFLEGELLWVKPQTSRQDPELSPRSEVFNHVFRQRCRLRSRETTGFCPCCLGLCCPVTCPSSQPAEQCGGRAGAGSRLGEVQSLVEGLHLQNTACKENHLPDRSEELFPDVQEGSKRTGKEAERRLQQSVLCFGCLLAALWCSFCFASLQMGKTLCQSLCCGWESGAWKHPSPFPYSECSGWGRS